jgi:hypothetical protein
MTVVTCESIIPHENGLQQGCASYSTGGHIQHAIWFLQPIKAPFLPSKFVSMLFSALKRDVNLSLVQFARINNI